MKEKFKPHSSIVNLRGDLNKEMSKHVFVEKKGSVKIPKNFLGPALSASGFKKIV